MTVTLPTFTPMEDSLWVTMCGRALARRLPRPILPDPVGDEVLDQLDHDCDAMHIDKNTVVSVAHRAKELDDVCQRFFARHPDAVGVDLGAGLDTRAFRVAPPPTVAWYDVDYPNVIAARRLVVPEREGASGLAADLTDPAWLKEVPGDRPVVVVADGLMAFLSQEQLTSLLDGIIDHFPSGDVAFNGYTRFAIWAAKHARGTKTVANLVVNPGFDDPTALERWVPRLHFVREVLLSREPEVADYPPVLRTYYRLAAHSTTISRLGTRILHYRFGE